MFGLCTIGFAHPISKRYLMSGENVSDNSSQRCLQPFDFKLCLRALIPLSLAVVFSWLILRLGKAAWKYGQKWLNRPFWAEIIILYRTG